MAAGTGDEQSGYLTELEEALLGPRKYTRVEVAEQTGVPVDRAERLWRALGFSGVTDDDVVFTDDDVTALGLLAALVDQGVIDREAEASLSRSVGQALARLADWQTKIVREVVSAPEGSREAETELVEAARELLPIMERLQSHVWRRHLIAAAGRLLPVRTEDPLSGTLVVGFADIVGFTRFSRTVADAELADFVDRFEGTTAEIISAHGGRVVKMIGDEVHFVTDAPAGAAEIALELIAKAEADEPFPDVRVGLAYGTVLTRLGDVYGPVVNVAARLTSLARPNTALVDRALVAALGEHAGYRLRRLRRVAVRGYERLQPWALQAR